MAGKSKQTDTEQDDRRRAPRASVELVIEYANVEHFCQDYARNLSLGGIFIETKTPLAIGTVIKLNFALPGYEGTIESTGRVVRVVPAHLADSEGLAQGMAVQFEDLSEQNKTVIDLLVQRALHFS